MLIARYRYRDRDSFGALERDQLRRIEGDIFGTHRVLDERLALADVTLLAPAPRPGKILAAAVNYRSHVPAARALIEQPEAPGEPQLFLKPASAIAGPGDAIVLPSAARRVDAEGELVAVIGRACRNVSPDGALACVFGYTCGNDVSARHWQRDDVQWWRAKGSDTFAPVGPAIATGLDPADLGLRTCLNGREVQAASTAAQIFTLAELISCASRVMTLEPGDLVFTGTPGEPPQLNDGDVVEVEIEGIGVLRNPVRREAA